MADLATLGLAVDSSQVKSATSALNDFSKAGQKAEDSANGVTGALSKAKGPSAEFAKNFAAADAQQGNYSKSANKVVDSLSNQFVRLNSTGKQWAQLSAIQKAGVDINSDAADKIAGMSGALYDLEKAQKQAAAANDNSTSSLDRFANTLTRRVLLGVAISQLKDFVQYVFSLNSALALLNDTASRSGIGGGSLQGIQAAGGASGLDTTKMLSDMLSFGHAVTQAKMGIGDLGNLLRANGQTVGTTEETFLKVADLIKNASSDYAKFSILQQAGLPATQQQAKFMEQGADAIRAQIKAAQDAGLTVQQQLLDKAEEFDKRWNTAWTNFSLQAKSALATAIDGMTSLYSKTEQYANKFGNADFWKNFYTPAQMQQAGIQSANFADKSGYFNPSTSSAAITKDMNALVAQRNGPSDDNATTIAQLQRQNQIIAQMGEFATVAQLATQKQNELNIAGRNGYGVSSDIQKALVNQTIAQAEQTRVNQAAQVGIFDLATAQKAANDNLQVLVDKHLLDPNNPAQYAAATTAAAKSIENLANSAKVAGAPLEQLQRLQNEAGSARTQLDQFSTTSLNSLSDNLVNIANGSQSAAEGFRNFGLAVVTALEKMIIQMLIIAPLAKSLQGFFGFGLFSDGGYVNPGSSANPLPGLTAADYGVGFASGGYTGPGGKYAPAGIVHRGEYVFDAASTSRIGVGNLERIRRSLPGFADGGYAGNVVSLPGTGQDNAPISFTYAPQIDARGADAQAVARLTSAFAKSQKDFTQNVQSVMIKYRANTPGSR